MSPCDRLVTCPGIGIGSSSSPCDPQFNKWKRMDGLYRDHGEMKTGSSISRNSLVMYYGQHCGQWAFENSSKEANLQTISPTLNITFLAHTKCSYRGLYACHIMTLTLCLTTTVGPLVIGTSSRGNIKSFFHPQTELSIKLEQGSTAICALKIDCRHLRAVKGYTEHNVQVATELRSHIHQCSLWYCGIKLAACRSSGVKFESLPSLHF